MLPGQKKKKLFSDIPSGHRLVQHILIRLFCDKVDNNHRNNRDNERREREMHGSFASLKLEIPPKTNEAIKPSAMEMRAPSHVARHQYTPASTAP